MVPGLHGVQLACPERWLYRPAVQFVQASLSRICAVILPYFPGKQEVQVLDPKSLAYRPLEHAILFSPNVLMMRTWVALLGIP